ncbi:MAG: UbiA family prenyltransferase [Verrucomicrobia bacterium]|nr:UbiA family prenyltransferase [Verrucomicrobiota bacterium]MBS0645790.1 UbiA family prenyltransferase [Verrucomicrobiota bacterium]
MQNQKLTLQTFVDLTRLEQTLFGLPFVLAGALLPLALYPRSMCSFSSWLWLILAFIAARVSGMAFNQLIDRHFDARNPRTQARPIPSGRATAAQARWIAWGALTVFIFICSQLNTVCLFLAPLAALLIYVYSYLKRVHIVCHFVLGTIHLLGPVMAAAAICNHLVGPALLLGLAALCSISGHDIVYAIQDYRFDRTHQLHSLPARFGLKASLNLSKLLHGMCVLFLLLLGFITPLNRIFFAAPLLASLLFLDFHQKVKPLVDDPELSLNITPLFFRCNTAIAFISLLFVALGVLCKG